MGHDRRRQLDPTGIWLQCRRLACAGFTGFGCSLGAHGRNAANRRTGRFARFHVGRQRKERRKESPDFAADNTARRNVFCAPTARTMRSCREVHAYFCRIEGLEALLVYLRSAQKALRWACTCSITLISWGVGGKGQVIPVRLLADRIMTDPANAEVLHTLHQAGCEIRLFGDGDRETYHMKTAIVDGSQVWTGSANWTRAAFAQNIEDALCFDSAEIASFYAAYFDAVWQNAVAWTPVDGQVQTDTAGSPRRTTDTRQVQSLPPTGPRTDYDSLTVEPVSEFPVYAQVEYLPDDTYFPALIRSIDTAKQSILGLVYVFSETQSDAPHQTALIQALVRAVNRGVYVYLVLYTPASPVDRLMEMHSNQAERLRSQGVDVRLAHPARPLHAKLFVVDQHRALLGSHNWSEGSLSGARVREASLMLTLPEPGPPGGVYPVPSRYCRHADKGVLGYGNCPHSSSATTPQSPTRRTDSGMDGRRTMKKCGFGIGHSCWPDVSGLRNLREPIASKCAMGPNWKASFWRKPAWDGSSGNGMGRFMP